MRKWIDFLVKASYERMNFCMFSLCVESDVFMLEQLRKAAQLSLCHP